MALFKKNPSETELTSDNTIRMPKSWSDFCEQMTQHPICKNIVNDKPCKNLALGGRGEHGLCQHCLEQKQRKDIRHI